MANTFQQLVNRFVEYMAKAGVPYSSWYVGVSKDAKNRLAQHGVPSSASWWIYDQAVNSATARQAEAHFISLGTDGGSGGGDTTADMVYAYLKGPNTNP